MVTNSITFYSAALLLNCILICFHSVVGRSFCNYKLRLHLSHVGWQFKSTAPYRSWKIEELSFYSHLISQYSRYYSHFNTPVFTFCSVGENLKFHDYLFYKELLQKQIYSNLETPFPKLKLNDSSHSSSSQALLQVSWFPSSHWWKKIKSEITTNVIISGRFSIQSAKLPIKKKHIQVNTNSLPSIYILKLIDRRTEQNILKYKMLCNSVCYYRSHKRREWGENEWEKGNVLTKLLPNCLPNPNYHPSHCRKSCADTQSELSEILWGLLSDEVMCREIWLGTNSSIFTYWP